MANASRSVHAPDLASLTGVPRSTIHQLRTPLTSIRGYAQLLQRGARSPEQTQRAYQTIQREAERMANMLNQLSRVAEICNGPADSVVTRFDLVRLTETAMHLARARWPEYVFQHDGDCRPDSQDTASSHFSGPQSDAGIECGAAVSASPIRLAEVLAILIDNAAVYSEPGSVIQTTSGRMADFAYVSVCDEGIGIPMVDQERIFGCFERGTNVSQAGPASSHGLGVGLFIARAVVTAADGRLWAVSNQGRGTTFHLALPLSA